MNLLQASVHMKFLHRDLLALTIRPTHPPTFFHHSHTQVLRVEAVGTVVSRHRTDKFLKFLLDDGTGVVPCILWLNHLHQNNQRPVPRSVARLRPLDLELAAEMAEDDAETVRLGMVFRVRGQVTVYMGQTQITVRDVLEERDPNAEILHWLDCIRLARSYDLPPQAPGPST